MFQPFQHSRNHFFFMLPIGIECGHGCVVSKQKQTIDHSRRKKHKIRRNLETLPVLPPISCEILRLCLLTFTSLSSIFPRYQKLSNWLLLSDNARERKQILTTLMSGRAKRPSNEPPTEVHETNSATSPSCGCGVSRT